MILGFAHDEFYRVSFFIADGPDHIFGYFLGIVIHANGTRILTAAKEGGFRPTDIVGNTLTQKRFFDELLAIRVGDLAQFDFVVHLY